VSRDKDGGIRRALAGVPGKEAGTLDGILTSRFGDALEDRGGVWVTGGRGTGVDCVSSIAETEG
jgi:hypothetical protein